MDFHIAPKVPPECKNTLQSECVLDPNVFKFFRDYRHVALLFLGWMWTLCEYKWDCNGSLRGQPWADKSVCTTSPDARKWEDE